MPERAAQGKRARRQGRHYERLALRRLGLAEQPIQQDGQTADGQRWADGRDSGLRVEVVASKRLSITALKKKLEQARSKSRGGKLPIAVGVQVTDPPELYAFMDLDTLDALIRHRWYD